MDLFPYVLSLQGTLDMRTSSDNLKKISLESSQEFGTASIGSRLFSLSTTNTVQLVDLLFYKESPQFFYITALGSREP